MNPRNFMDLYAYSAPTSIPFEFNCRLSVGGYVLREFRSARDPVSGDSKFFVAGGATFAVSPGTVVTAELHLMSTIGVENPAYSDTFASISAFGVFT